MCANKAISVCSVYLKNNPRQLCFVIFQLEVCTFHRFIKHLTIHRRTREQYGTSSDITIITEIQPVDGAQVEQSTLAVGDDVE